jgi:putative transposase
LLERLAGLRGLPRSITVDHGPEFEGQALDASVYKRTVRLAFIRSGKPIENACVESFNGRFRDEWLNEHWFVSMQRARSVIETWRIEYSSEQPRKRERKTQKPRIFNPGLHFDSVLIGGHVAMSSAE